MEGEGWIPRAPKPGLQTDSFNPQVSQIGNLSEVRGLLQAEGATQENLGGSDSMQAGAKHVKLVSKASGSGMETFHQAYFFHFAF